MLITFSGVDNAGKSTQLERLKRALHLDGYRVATFWYRPGYSPELDALRAFVRRARPGALPTTKEPNARERVFAKPSVQVAWSGVSLVDTLLQLGLKVRAALMRDQIVLCDRYLADAMLDLELRFPALAPSLPYLEPPVRLALPTPSLQILFTLPIEEVQRRAAIEKEPFPDTPAVQAARYAGYMRLADTHSFQVVDAGRPIGEVHRDVHKLVRNTIVA